MEFVKFQTQARSPFFLNFRMEDVLLIYLNKLLDVSTGTPTNSSNFVKRCNIFSLNSANHTERVIFRFNSWNFPRGRNISYKPWLRLLWRIPCLRRTNHTTIDDNTLLLSAHPAVGIYLGGKFLQMDHLYFFNVFFIFFFIFVSTKR